MDRFEAWLEEHAPGRLLSTYYWFRNRLTGVRCYAEGCDRLLLLHTPRQLRRCYDTPLGIVPTEHGMARAVVAEAEEVTRTATAT